MNPSTLRIRLADGGVSKRSDAEDNVGTLLTGQADLLEDNPICILMVFRRCPCLRLGLCRQRFIHTCRLSSTDKSAFLINGERRRKRGKKTKKKKKPKCWSYFKPYVPSAKFNGEEVKCDLMKLV